MADIKQIRLNDTDYAIKDARIITGTLDESGEVTIEGEMVVFFSMDDACDTYAGYFVGGGIAVQIIKDGIGYIIHSNGNQSTLAAWEGCRYIAIIME